MRREGKKDGKDGNKREGKGRKVKERNKGREGKGKERERKGRERTSLTICRTVLICSLINALSSMN